MAPSPPASFPRLGQTFPVPESARGRWCRVSVPRAARTEARPPFFAFEDGCGNLVGLYRFLVEHGSEWRTVVHVPPEFASYRVDAGPKLNFRPISRVASFGLILAGQNRAVPTLLGAALTGRLREQFTWLAWTLHAPAGYVLWVKHFDAWPAAPPPTAPEQATVGALVFQRDPEAPAALEATMASIAAQGVAMPHAVLAGPDSARWREAASGLAADYVALIQAGEVLPLHASWFAGAKLRLLGLPATAIADEDRLGADGDRSDPLFRPQPNHALMLSGTLSRGVWFVRRDALLAHPDDRDPGWAECLRLAVWLRRHEAGEDGGQRIPFILTHRRPDAEAAPDTAIAAVVNDHLIRSAAPLRARPSFPLVLRAESVPRERVAIIIPSTLRSSLAHDCIRSILEGTGHRDFEMVVGVTQVGELDDTQRREAAVIKADPRTRVVHLRHPEFNFSRVCNELAAMTSARVILLLNDDVSVIAPGWLEEMLAHLADPAVAIVGAKLLYPDRTVQHGGVIIGLAGLCDHANRHLVRTAPGYACRAIVAQEFSAVTGACMLIRRPVYEAVKGLDEGYPSAFNDVDLCLRVRELGYRVVFAASAELVHHESQTYGEHYAGERATFEAEEVARMRRRWEQVIADDPFYNPNQDLVREREWQPVFPPRHLALMPQR